MESEWILTSLKGVNISLNELMNYKKVWKNFNEF